MIKVRDKKFLKQFGKHIRELRKKKGISQEELYFNAGLGKNQIGNIERGEVNPTLSTLKAISSALNIPLSQLFEMEK